MKTHILLLTVLLLFVSNLKAQKNANLLDYDDQVNFILPLEHPSNAGSYVTITSSNTINYFDANDANIWSVSLGASFNAYKAVVETSSGDIIVVGRLFIMAIPESYSVLHAIKINNNGDLIQEKSYYCKDQILLPKSDGGDGEGNAPPQDPVYEVHYGVVCNLKPFRATRNQEAIFIVGMAEFKSGSGSGAIKQYSHGIVFKMDEDLNFLNSNQLPSCYTGDFPGFEAAHGLFADVAVNDDYVYILDYNVRFRTNTTPDRSNSVVMLNRNDLSVVDRQIIHDEQSIMQSIGRIFVNDEGGIIIAFDVSQTGVFIYSGYYNTSINQMLFTVGRKINEYRFLDASLVDNPAEGPFSDRNEKTLLMLLKNYQNKPVLFSFNILNTCFETDLDTRLAYLNLSYNMNDLWQINAIVDDSNFFGTFLNRFSYSSNLACNNGLLYVGMNNGLSSGFKSNINIFPIKNTTNFVIDTDDGFCHRNKVASIHGQLPYNRLVSTIDNDFLFEVHHHTDLHPSSKTLTEICCVSSVSRLTGNEFYLCPGETFNVNSFLSLLGGDIILGVSTVSYDAATGSMYAYDILQTGSDYNLNSIDFQGYNCTDVYVSILDDNGCIYNDRFRVWYTPKIEEYRYPIIACTNQVGVEIMADNVMSPAASIMTLLPSQINFTLDGYVIDVSSMSPQTMSPYEITNEIISSVTQAACTTTFYGSIISENCHAKHGGNSMLLSKAEYVTNYSPVIYPNPSNNKISIVINNKVSRILIFNIAGQQVHMEIVQGRENVEINVEHLPAGIYTVVYSSDVDKVAPQKFVKQ